MLVHFLGIGISRTVIFRSLLRPELSVKKFWLFLRVSLVPGLVFLAKILLYSIFCCNTCNCKCDDHNKFPNCGELNVIDVYSAHDLS